AVDVHTGRVSDRVLVLDQGMILAAIANALDDDVLARTFCAGAVEAVIRPLIAPEHFEASTPPLEGLPGVIDPNLSGHVVPAPGWKSDGPSDPVIPRPHLALVGQRDALLADAAQAPVKRRNGQPRHRRRERP